MARSSKTIGKTGQPQAIPEGASLTYSAESFASATRIRETEERARQASQLDLDSLPLRMSRGLRRERYALRRNPVSCIIIHTAGAGPWKRWKKGKHATPFAAAIDIYQRLTDAGPHYVVGQDEDQVVRTCPDDLCAWGVGTSKWNHRGKRYQKRSWARERHAWWKESFPDLASPLALLDGHAWRPSKGSSRFSVNANALHIEVSPPVSGPRDPWSDACWNQLRSLVLALRQHHGLEAFRAVLTHSEVHPLSRTTRTGMPWDPGARQWQGDMSRARLTLVDTPGHAG